jgi:hypothetical protein
MCLRLLDQMEIQVAPQTKPNDRMTVTIFGPVSSTIYFDSAWVARRDCSHLSKLLVAVLGTGKQLDRAFSVVSVGKGNLVYQTHTD